MSKTKITDLRRVVKERLTKKGVVDLSDFKLKAINISEGNDKKIRNNLERNIKKIGNSLILQTFDLDISDEEKIDKLNELLVGDIKTTITCSDEANIKRLVKSFNKGKDSKGETYLSVEVEEGETKAHTYSTMYFEPTKRQQGHFYFRSEYKKSYIPFTCLKRLVGTMYFFNKLREYIKSNKKMSKLIYIKYIQLEGLYKHEEYKSKVDSLANKYNLPITNHVTNYLKDMTAHQLRTIKRTNYLDYLDWIDNDKYFSLENIFDTSYTLEEHCLYAIKNVKLTSHFFNHLYDLNIEEEYDAKEELKLDSDYARSYETKKNIPGKVLDKMKTTKFKKHFGYVEFDELVDLEKVEIIENEWVEINKKILFPIAKDHSLRFRRLGKHKASGLYFSGMKAVCIDLEGPSSLVHELMHMIDYTSLANTTLSSMFNFRGIIERYRDIVNNQIESLADDNSFKSTWKGNSKYNKEYYLSTKEIFARCGEIYIANILDINSSLVKADNKILYPVHDEFLLSLIEKYYASIIQIAPKENIEYKVSCNSKPPSEINNTKIISSQQICVFDIIGVS